MKKMTMIMIIMILTLCARIHGAPHDSAGEVVGRDKDPGTNIGIEECVNRILAMHQAKREANIPINKPLDFLAYLDIELARLKESRLLEAAGFAAEMVGYNLPRDVAEYCTKLNSYRPRAGNNNIDNGFNNRFIAGNDNTVTGNDNRVNGNGNRFNGNDNYVAGNNNNVIGNNNNVNAGNGNTVIGQGLFVNGNNNNVRGINNIVRGSNNSVSGNGKTVIGNGIIDN